MRPVSHTHGFCMGSESTSSHYSAASSTGLMHAAELSESLFYRHTGCNLTNTCATQTGLFWYQISSFKSQDASTQTGVDECACFAYCQMQVDEEHTCLHTAGWRTPTCVQTIAFLLSPPTKDEQTTWSMLGKWFTQCIYYFTLLHLKNSKLISFILFFLKPSQNQH